MQGDHAGGHPRKQRQRNLLSRKVLAFLVVAPLAEEGDGGEAAAFRGVAGEMTACGAVAAFVLQRILLLVASGGEHPLPREGRCHEMGFGEVVAWGG
uniref:Uncharacterized protein n=1 Tax=Chromera velia CCMP2878 TaxID=1169474 RepID=A0A0G4HXE8_9ALVE|eukprot:Cvel_9266.t1-p1 / transcript=Cvel_9266.t1 / gene=Cvel_9266 / organism=Chromera_velia_CCMP2878 / gene_product=hypothetical protein / transcript_product=hypothetical protein / location=Cvel_scaffold529:67602-67889(-) / protein_length=96 / sequence_SO=supercontig / SO=protein_coding / is_pseudo=false